VARACEPASSTTGHQLSVSCRLQRGCIDGPSVEAARQAAAAAHRIRLPSSVTGEQLQQEEEEQWEEDHPQAAAAAPSLALGCPLCLQEAAPAQPVSVAA
jgi:hypothetical protein